MDFYDQLTIYRTWQKHQDTTRAILAPFQENPEFWGIAVRKGDEALKDKLIISLMRVGKMAF